MNKINKMARNITLGSKIQLMEIDSIVNETTNFKKKIQGFFVIISLE